MRKIAYIDEQRNKCLLTDGTNVGWYALSDVKRAMAMGSLPVDNFVLENGQLKGTQGSADRYTGDTLFIIGGVTINGVCRGFDVIVGATGEKKRADYQSVVRTGMQYKLANAKIQDGKVVLLGDNREDVEVAVPIAKAPVKPTQPVQTQAPVQQTKPMQQTPQATQPTKVAALIGAGSGWQHKEDGVTMELKLVCVLCDGTGLATIVMDSFSEIAELLGKPYIGEKVYLDSTKTKILAAQKTEEIMITEV